MTAVELDEENAIENTLETVTGVLTQANVLVALVASPARPGPPLHSAEWWLAARAYKP